MGNILFCGVGGQGILLASEITSFALIKAGLDIKKSEVHGMAQRGGSVVAHLKYGDKVYSPLIEPGAADIEVAFEMLESLRYLPYLNRESRVIVNTQKILPPSVTTGVEPYPDDVLAQLRGKGLAVFPVNAFEAARLAGETKAVNMILVGCLSAFLPVEAEVFRAVIKERVPERFMKANIEAFKQGREIIGNLLRAAG
ncbi:MAG: indolepyruvate oxidoreductase subunit beta [Nitrospiraceae bacterium]|nr:indolepyruvate oxidoreductase subunit beta [Nitrospiraceae bacterium]